MVCYAEPDKQLRPAEGKSGVIPVCVATSAGLFIGDKTMRRILLTQGKFALVDDEDFEKLSKFKWCAAKNHYGGYTAVRNCQCPFGKQHTILMHRQIMSCPQNKEIDHQDHNPLNNQKFNLRVCTHAENMRNGQIPRNNISGFKGVNWQKGKIYKRKQYKGKWESAIGFNRQRIHLGLFDSKIEAAKAYDKKAKELFGEFANTNF